MPRKPEADQPKFLQYVELVGRKLVLHFGTHGPQPDELQNWVRRIREHLALAGFELATPTLQRGRFANRPGMRYLVTGTIASATGDAEARLSLAQFRALRNMLEPNRAYQGTISFAWEANGRGELKLVGHVVAPEVRGIRRGEGTWVHYNSRVKVQITPQGEGVFTFVLPPGRVPSQEERRALGLAKTVANHLGIFVKGDITFDPKPGKTPQ